MTNILEPFSDEDICRGALDSAADTIQLKPSSRLFAERWRYLARAKCPEDS